MKIRLEEEKDYKIVENLVRETFWNVYRPGCFEHLVIHNLRKDPCFVKELDYIIEENETIIGNIVYALANLKSQENEEEKILIFGPVSIIPKYQNKGYGRKLIEYTLAKAKDLGYSAVAITGDPNYYHRFGFESASKYDIYYNGLDKTEESPFFMIKILDKEKIANLKGIYSDPNCYNIDEKKLEEFDKKFPEKIKKRQKGQLE